MSEIKFFEILSKRLKGQNLSEIARTLDISPQLLHDWVSSKRHPSLKNIEAIKRLASYLDLELEELLLGSKTLPQESLITSLSFKDNNREYVVQIKRVR